MKETETPNKNKKNTTLRYLVLIVILGLAVNLILPKLMDINQTIHVLQNMTWWLVLAALLSEALVYIAYGYSMKSVLEIQGNKLSVLETSAIFIASYSIGTVAGGWIGSAASSVGLFAKKGVRKVDATIAGLLPSMLANIPLSLIGIAGLISMAIGGTLTQSRLIQYLIFIIILLFISFAPLIGLAFPKAAFKTVNWLLWNWARLRKKDYNPSDTQNQINNFFDAWRLMGNGNWQRPLLGVTFYYLLDMACMYLIFRASGYAIAPGILIAGYALPLILAKMAFIVPGGIGVIETSMAGIFTSMAIPADIALVVVLGYRLISFWLPISFGFLSYFLLNRKSSMNSEA